MVAAPRQALLACASHDGDVAEGALWLAAEDVPAVRPDQWLHTLDRLGEEVTTAISGAAESPRESLARVVRKRLRLRGAGGGDPRAHYLPDVMRRGSGVPIACAVIWMALGRRAGIAVQGVNLPGHFIIRVGDELIDPVSGGEPLDEQDVRRLVATSTGGKLRGIDPAWLRVASTRDVLARMSRNLRGCYACLENWPLALQSADRCVDLLPDEPAERRDRGILLWRMGQCRAALDDLRAYLDDAPPEASDRTGIMEIAGRLRAFLN